MSDMLSLEKVEEQVKLVLDKIEDHQMSRDFKAQIVLALDYSGSMRDEYRDGLVQEAVERLLSVGVAIDPDKEVDLFLFHDGVIELNKPLTLQNTDGYIDKYIFPKLQMGGTRYAPVINAIVEKYKPKAESGGWFGLKKGGFKPLKYPIYVLLITDGENDYKEQRNGDVERALIEASKYGIFIQFTGIGASSFGTLEKLDDMEGRLVDNADFFALKNLHKTSDNELFGKMFNEFPNAVTRFEQLGYIEKQ